MYDPSLFIMKDISIAPQISSVKAKDIIAPMQQVTVESVYQVASIEECFSKCLSSHSCQTIAFKPFTIGNSTCSLVNDQTVSHDYEKQHVDFHFYSVYRD